MSNLPKISADGRGKNLVIITLLGVAQAMAMGVAAFATRSIFSSFHQDAEIPLASLIKLIVCAVLIAGFQMIARVRAEALGQSYAKSLRYSLYRHLSGMSHDTLSQKRLGALSLRFVGDLSAARGWAGLGIARLIAATIVLPGAVVALYILSPALMLAGMGPVIVSLLLAIVFAVGLERYHRTLRSRRALVAIRAMERIAIAPELDVARRTKRELKRLNKESTMLSKNAVARVQRISWLRLFPQIGAAFGGVAILTTASLLGYSAAEAAGALAVLGIIALPLRDLAGIWDRFNAWQIARDKINVLFAQKSELRKVKRVGKPVSVEFCKIRHHGLFADLIVPAGSCVTVSGPPSGGKSILLSLVAAQNLPKEGKVCFGGADTHLPRIAYISDQPIILQGSLRRNLALSASKRPNSDLLTEVSQTFGLTKLITRLGGLGGRINESGKNLSAGEIIRIELVRAVQARPDLVVIDNRQLQLDPERYGLINELRQRTNATIFIVGVPLRGDDSIYNLKVSDGNVKLKPAGKTAVSVLKVHPVRQLGAAPH